MQKWIETTGKNEEDAVNVALEKLGMDRDEVSVEIVERAKSGFLGIGGNPAKVKVSYEAPDEPEVKRAAPVPAPVPAREKSLRKAAPAAPKARVERDIDPNEPVVDSTEQIKTFLAGLLQRMEVEATPVVVLTDEGHYKVELKGENLGALIGHRGETLDAIQQITSYAVNKNRTRRARIHVDCENYRAKREVALEQLARRVADRVIKSRRNVTLEPMNAYERHVVHTALQEVAGVTTYSTGTEPNRRTVVAYAKDTQES